MSRKSSKILDFSVCASFMSHKSMRFGLFMHFRGHPLLQMHTVECHMFCTVDRLQVPILLPFWSENRILTTVRIMVIANGEPLTPPT